jgi:hypothetical protein
LVLVAGTKSHAQILIPYLGKNGLYGLADTTGKLKITPQFEHLNYFFKKEDKMVLTKKDGKNVHVFRNGALLESFSRGYGFVENYGSDPSKPDEDSWNIFARDQTDKTYFTDMNSGKTVETELLKNNGYTDLATDNHRVLGLAWNKARYGAIRTQEPGGKFNFLNKDLNRIFSQNFNAASVVDEEYFILRNDNMKCAIGNHDGKILTSFEFKNILPTQCKGVFIIETDTRNYGLTNEKGKLLVEPIYNSILSVSKDYFIFSDLTGKTGISNQEGKLLFPLQEGKLSFVRENIFIKRIGNHSSLIDALGNDKSNGKTWEFLSYESNKFPSKPFFYYKSGNLAGILDQNLNSLIEAKYNSIVPITHQGKLFFELNETPEYPNPKRGLADQNGKILFPTEYLQFGFPHEVPFINVYKGKDPYKAESRGLSDLNGNIILPCTFEHIHFSLGPKITIYAQPLGKIRYEAYDVTGKRIPELDRLSPMESKEAVVIQPTQYRKNPKYLFFANEKKSPIPDSWGDIRHDLIGFDSPKGIGLLRKVNEEYLFYDSDLRLLLPKNGEIPKKFFNARSFAEFGLVPIWEKDSTQVPLYSPSNGRITSDGDDTSPMINESPSQERISTNDDVPPPMVQEKEMNSFPGKNGLGIGQKTDQAVQEISNRGNDATGIMNAKGEWVLPFKDNALYTPISYNLILEYAMNGSFKEIKFPRKLHKVNTSNPTSWDISYGSDLMNINHFGNAQIFQVKMEAGKNKSYCTWFTNTGEPLSEFIYTSGPQHLSSKNLVSLNENGQEKWRIVSNKLQSLAELPNFDGKASMTQGFIIGSVNGKYGVIDSLGKSVMPFEYNELTMLNYLPFVTEKVAVGGKYKYILRNFAGKILQESYFNLGENSTNNDTMEQYVYINVREDNSAHKVMIFNLGGEKVLEVMDARYSGSWNGNKRREVSFLNSANKTFYVDIKNKIEYREK